MKKVFEGYVSARFAPPKKGYDGGNYYNLGGYSLTQTRQCTRRVRITVEDLPEQPEKNCGNCESIHCMNCGSVGGKPYSMWRPKKPGPLKPEKWPGKTPIAYDREGNVVGFEKEPQGWEERFRQEHHKGLAECQIRSILAFIRQVAAEEREKGRKEGYNQACEEYGPIARAQGEMIGKNKHRGEK